MHLLIAATVVGAGVAVAWAAAPVPALSIEECFAEQGLPGVTVYPDGGVDVPVFGVEGTNAGQAWDAKADVAYDLCVP